MSSACCSSCKDQSSIVNGALNGTPDLLNRTSYLTAPYAIGPPLSTYTPSSALSVAPVQGCGGYSFVSPALGGGAPLGLNLAASNQGSPMAPTIGSFMTGLPSVMGNNPNVSVPNGNATMSFSSGSSTNVGSGTTLNVPPGTTNINVNPGGGGSVGPVSPFSRSVLNDAPLQGGSSMMNMLQRSAVQQSDPTTIVGISSSSKNLMRATGETNINVSSGGDGGGGVCSADGSFSAPIQTTVVNPPPPMAVAPGIVAGGVGGIALATPAFLGGMPNLNMTSGIAFANDCGNNYGYNTPLAIPGPIAPPINVLGSNYLANFASQPYYSGLNNSEPAAIMNSANPLYPGFVMLARDWKGTPQVIISKPNDNGCPTFETLCIFDEHNESCNCPKCNQYIIDECEIRCINGWGDAVPSTTDSTTNSLMISSFGTVSTKLIADEEFYFLISASDSPMGSSKLLCKQSGAVPPVPAAERLCISVNGMTNRNILMYNGVSYTIKFSINTSGMDADMLLAAKEQKLIFTNDPVGGVSGDCAASLVDCSFGPGINGLQVGQKMTYTPSADCHSCLTTIFYQLSGVAYGGGPITIL